MRDKQVEKKNLKELFKHNISIPLYHREYKWGESEVGEIFESVIEGFEKEKSLYMGTLIFYECEDRCEVIDGQQRLGTLF